MLTRETAYRIVGHVQFKKHNFDDFITSWYKYADLDTLERLYNCIRNDFTLDVAKFMVEFPDVDN